MAKAEAGGALGVGTERYAAGPPAGALPEGAVLRPVRVHYARWVLGWLGHAHKAGVRADSAAEERLMWCRPPHGRMQ